MIVPDYPFIALISSIILSLAIPVLVEIKKSLTLDPIKIGELVTPQTKVIMPIQVQGNPCDIDAICTVKFLSKQLLPQADDLSSLAVNISIGVVDKSLGAGSGINIFSTNVEIQEVGKKLTEVIRSS